VGDSKLFLSFCIGKLQDVVTTVNNDISMFVAYLCNNCLLANPDKTKIMFFGTPQVLKQIPVDTLFTFLWKTIQPVQNAKDLGLILDSNLSFDQHIKQSVSSCMKKLHQVNRIKDLFKKSTNKINIRQFSTNFSPKH
jgi:hypothetical protein